MKLFFAIVFTLYITSKCHGAKILMVFHFGTYSHYILGHVLAEELASRGHEVTMVRLIKKESTYKNLKFIDLDINFRERWANTGNLTLTPDGVSRLSNPYYAFYLLNVVLLEVSDLIFKSQVFQNMLNDEKHFDLVIVEQMFSDSLKYLCTHYNAPCIALFSVGACEISNYLFANPSPTSYIPGVFLTFGAEMSFYERLNNFIYLTFTSIATRMFFLPKYNEQVHKYFPNAPNIDEMLSRVSLLFLNSHFSVTQPVPLTPNTIEIGGIHLKPSGKLPSDIKKFLDEATEGAIVFSLGSNLKSTDFSPKIRADIIKALSKLKENILWKFEDENASDLPPNIKVAKWLPMQDVLAHPNIKLLITHGGLLSLTEAVYFGVPIVGIPFISDQSRNIAEAERTGFGVKLLYENLNEESLTKAVKTVLEDKSYSDVAKKRSALARDRPLKPMDTAVYWVEYLLRHKTGEHLYPKEAMALPWYAFYQIDVVAFLLLIIVVLLVLLYKIYKVIRKMCKTVLIIEKVNKMKQQ